MRGLGDRANTRLGWGTSFSGKQQPRGNAGVPALHENLEGAMDQISAEGRAGRGGRRDRCDQVELEPFYRPPGDRSDQAFAASEVMKYGRVGYADLFGDLLQPD